MLCTVQSFVFKIVTCIYINLAVKKLYTHFEHISHSWIVNKLLIQIQFFALGIFKRGRGKWYLIVKLLTSIGTFTVIMELRCFAT